MSRSDRRTRLEHLEQEIPQLKLHLKQLEEERREIFASLAFPVLTLPMEVTSEIFVHCLPGASAIPRTTDAPLLLARICRQWRDIALSLPQLWSTFTFYADSPRSQARDHLINCWLSRSRHHSLSICLYDGYMEPEDDTAVAQGSEYERAVAISESIQACLELVGKHSSRLRDLQLRLMPSELQNPSISFPEGGFPLLEHLAIGRWAASHADFTLARINLFGTAPRLRSVEMVLDSQGHIDIRLFSIPWAQLTKFTGTLFWPEECFFVLRQCPALVDCTFAECTSEDTAVPPPPLPPIIALKSLKVGTTYSLFTVFGALTLPRLETLSAELGVGHISLVTQLVARSGCTLRHFKFTWTVDGNETQFFDCLQHMPALSSLELSAIPPKPCVAIFDRLCEDLELVPDLRSLTIVSYNITPSFPFATLLAMLHARSRPARLTPLRRFQLCGAYDWGIIDLSGFEELVREGMEIEMRSPRRILL
ncbi:hypothetical protein B0H17DRAFT_1174521 [Mycena rosella]|uniref:F-box domain-containing protein n=1 Tax=Mycena rosella TaxID=1033263 RepID=A0AAD7GXH2_MYCRO|nr:hypothetical protein B0H17DRAFT_1174521 [Mycena rosella]